MDHPKHAGSSVRALPILAVLALLTSLALIPILFVSKAQTKRGGKGLVQRTASHAVDLPNYDIRADKTATGKLAEIRERLNRSAASVADKRKEAAKAEAELTSKASDVKVVYGPQSRMPEIVAPKETLGKAALSRATGGSRTDSVRRFIGENHALFGVDRTELDLLKVTADYTNPGGGMSFVHLEQDVNGVPVFAGEVRAGFAKNGDLVRIVNNLASGAAEGVSVDFGDPLTALQAAAQAIGRDPHSTQATSEMVATADNTVRFGDGDEAPTAEKMYFPTEPGVLVPAWRVLIWEPVNAYYVVVDAGSQTVLWRKNLTEDQAQTATYSVYSNTTSILNVADSPSPLTPGPISPNLGTQGIITGRQSISLIGNEGVYSFNNLGWLTDGANILDGNAVQAGPDRNCEIDPANGTQCRKVTDPEGNVINVPLDGIDANISGSSFRNFTFAYNPGPGSPPPGDSPPPAGAPANDCTVTPAATSEYQKGAATQLFYIANRFHDETYRLGFTEQSHNFQANNFGRGGSSNDRISAQAQDCTGVNNANFTAPADGTRGRMQMYIFPNMSPDRDGSLDADIVVHELTHGLSSRLHGNTAGLTSVMSRGMGEGWSDFYALALLSEPTDPLDGVYSSAGYSTLMLGGPGFTSNYYYGIRRFPKAILSSTGGPNNRPHNPLTFADIDASTSNLSNGAFPPAFTNSANDAVHASGEVWSSMLWEIRAKYIARLGWEVGNRRILQQVTDAMKLSPLNPTFLDARDAILAAAMASGSEADVREIWEGFASRGLGAGASVSVIGAGGGETRVTESYDLPNLTIPGITVSDVTGDNDGYPEPGEPVRITIPLENHTGSAATNVTVQLEGGQALAYGTIAHNGSASHEFNYTIPANAGCGALIDLQVRIESSLGLKIIGESIVVGVPNPAIAENFDGVTAPAIPNGWTVSTEGTGTPFVTSTVAPDSAPNSAFAANTASPGGTILTSPSYAIQSTGASFSFRHSYRTEAGWDGGLLEFSINGGAWTEFTPGTGSFLTGGYNGILGDSNGNPIETKKAWTGDSNGYITTKAYFPIGSAGQNVRLRWRFGADDNTTGGGGNPGWNIDNVSVTNSYSCTFTPPSIESKRADFDGDGKSDLAVFRPSTGSWFILPAQGSGFLGVGWGTDGDIPIPADWDNDGKTDVAVYRPGVGGNAGYFLILKSSDLTLISFPFGALGDIPVVRDYDGDKLPDFAVYRPSTGYWYIQGASGFQSVQFGGPGDLPVAGDFDGDGKGDFTVFRGGQWIGMVSSNGYVFNITWGLPTDVPVPADYDHDGKDDISIFRPSDGGWWILRSSDIGITAFQWGQNGDVPVPGDYDGDGKYDPAVYRAGSWYVTHSMTGTYGAAGFGAPGDIPIHNKYLP